MHHAVEYDATCCLKWYIMLFKVMHHAVEYDAPCCLRWCIMVFKDDASCCLRWTNFADIFFTIQWQILFDVSDTASVTIWKKNNVKKVWYDMIFIVPLLRKLRPFGGYESDLEII